MIVYNQILIILSFLLKFHSSCNIKLILLTINGRLRHSLLWFFLLVVSVSKVMLHNPSNEHFSWHNVNWILLLITIDLTEWKSHSHIISLFALSSHLPLLLPGQSLAPLLLIFHSNFSLFIHAICLNYLFYSHKMLWFAHTFLFLHFSTWSSWWDHF